MLSTVWFYSIRIVLSIMSAIYQVVIAAGFIPNREVKPACADGTAMQCGRVGSRLLSNRELQNDYSEALFCFPPEGRIVNNIERKGTEARKLLVIRTCIFFFHDIIWWSKIFCIFLQQNIEN